MHSVEVTHVGSIHSIRHADFDQRVMQRTSRLKYHHLGKGLFGVLLYLMKPFFFFDEMACFTLLDLLCAHEGFVIRCIGKSQFIADSPLPDLTSRFRRNTPPPELSGAMFVDYPVEIGEDVLLPNSLECCACVVTIALSATGVLFSLFLCNNQSASAQFVQLTVRARVVELALPRQ